MNQDWEDRVTALWARFDDYAEEETDEARFRAEIDALVAELPDGSPLGPFEQACAWDSTGRSDQAVPLYREALRRGLADASPYKARRTKIQLASSLRNTGRADEGLALLAPELVAPPTSWTTPYARRSRSACPASAATGRDCRWPWAPWPRTCPATSGRWRTTPGCSWSRRSSRGRDAPRSGDHPTIRSFC